MSPITKPNISSKNIHKLIYECGQLKDNENIAIIYDYNTFKIAKFIKDFIAPCQCVLLKADVQIHGQEPSEEVAQLMMESDLIFGLTSFSMAHTKARKNATANGSRYLSLPEYSLDVINSKAFEVDFIEVAKISNRLIKLLKDTENLSIKTNKGTDISLNIESRNWNDAPGILLHKGRLGSPPDCEINIAPVENLSNGTIVVDGSVPIPGIGLLSEDIILNVRSGVVSYTKNKYSYILDNSFGAKENNRIIGEFGIGLNNFAKLCGRMLEDEGTLGTCHFGVGSNSTIGGKNRANIHIDFIIKEPEIYADSELVFKKNKWLI